MLVGPDRHALAATSSRRGRLLLPGLSLEFSSADHEAVGQKNDPSSRGTSCREKPGFCGKPGFCDAKLYRFHPLPLMPLRMLNRRNTGMMEWPFRDSGAGPNV